MFAQFGLSNTDPISRPLSSMIKGAQKAGKDLMVGVRNTDMNSDQMEQKLRMLESERDRAGLDALNVTRKIVRLEKSLSDHKRLLQAISDSELPRVHRIIRVGLDRGVSVTALHQQVSKAAKSFVFTKAGQTEKDLALLTLRLGGPFLLHAHNKARHLPGAGVSSRYSAASGTSSERFRVSVTADMQKERTVLGTNLAACKRENSSLFGSDAPFVAILIDEFATQARPRWRQWDNHLLGFCQHAGELHCDMEFTSADVVLALKKKVDDGVVHLAKEVSNIGIAPFCGGSDNHFRPLLCLPTCKKDIHSEDQVKVFEALLDDLYNEGAVPLCLSSDGDAPRRQALTRVCASKNLKQSHDDYISARDSALSTGAAAPDKSKGALIYESLFELELFDYDVGPHEVTGALVWVVLSLVEFRNAVMSTQRITTGNTYSSD